MSTNNSINLSTNIKAKILKSSSSLDSSFIFEKANKEFSKYKIGDPIESQSYYYKAMTLLEFEKGVLLANAVNSLYTAFAVELFKQYREEFDCHSPAELSLAEAITLSFVRILDTQRLLKNAQERVKTRYDIQYISILSKELDRANRHYLTALQTLKLIKSPQLEVNIKTQTAIIGQNQVVQQKNEIN